MVGIQLGEVASAYLCTPNRDGDGVSGWCVDGKGGGVRGGEMRSCSSKRFYDHSAKRPHQSHLFWPNVSNGHCTAPSILFHYVLLSFLPFFWRASSRTHSDRFSY